MGIAQVVEKKDRCATGFWAVCLLKGNGDGRLSSTRGRLAAIEGVRRTAWRGRMVRRARRNRADLTKPL